MNNEKQNEFIDKLFKMHCQYHTHNQYLTICRDPYCTQPNRILCQSCNHSECKTKEIKITELSGIFKEFGERQSEQEIKIQKIIINSKEILKRISAMCNGIIEQIQKNLNAYQEKGIKQFDYPIESQDQMSKLANNFVSMLAYNQEKKRHEIIIEQGNIFQEFKEYPKKLNKIYDQLNSLNNSLKTPQFKTEQGTFRFQNVPTRTLYSHQNLNIRTSDYSEKLNVIAKAGDNYEISLTKLNDPNNNKELKEDIGDSIRCIKFSPNEYRLAYGMGKLKPQIHVYQFDESGNNTNRRILGAHAGGVIDLKFVTDDIIISGDSKTLYKWDLNKPIDDAKVKQENIENGQIIKQIEISQKNQELVAVALKNKIELYDTQNLVLLRSLKLDGIEKLHCISRFAFSPDGKQIAATWRKMEEGKSQQLMNIDKFIRRWDVASGNKVGDDIKFNLNTGSLISNICYSIDGKQIIIGCYDGIQSQINLDDFKKVNEIKLFKRPIISIIQSKNEGLMFVSNKGEIKKMIKSEQDMACGM